MHAALGGSEVYRAAVRAAMPDLPDWLVPYSIIGLEDLIRIANALGLAEGAKLLDWGCGTGGVGLWLAERSRAALCGVDQSPSAIELARSLATTRPLKESARFQVSDATETGLPDSSVDAIVSVDVLMFVDPQRATREIARVLRPGGIVALTTVEALVDPFTPTLVRDYRPLFEMAGLRVQVHETMTNHPARLLAFYQAIAARGKELRREVGTIADILLEEARNGIQRAGKPSRVRPIFLAARRTG